MIHHSMRTSCTLALAAAVAGPLAPGLWRVGAMVQESDRTRSTLHCHHGDRDWLHVALPRLPVADCLITRNETASGRVAINAACGGKARLTVTGAVYRDSFDLVARRVGPVGGNPRAQVTMLSQGRRTATRCPLWSGG